MSCIRCGSGGPLAESHIIPAAFFRQIKRESAILLQFGSSENAHRRKLPKGSYVTDILCPECDNWLNLAYERQAIKALIDGDGITYVYWINEGVHYWRMDDVDLSKLKLFLLSVLWRADRSEYETYRAFRLGEHAARIHDLVLRGDPGDQEEFSIVATRWDLRAMVLLPHAYEAEGVPFWEVNLGDWHFLVKAGRMPLPEFLTPFELVPGLAGVAIPRELARSSHLELMRSMVVGTHERRQSRMQGDSA